MTATGKEKEIAYTLTRRRGSRRLVLRYDVHGALHVTAPWYASRREIDSFVLSCAPRLPRREVRTFAPGSSVMLEGRAVTLRKGERTELAGGILFVKGDSKEEVVSQMKAYWRERTRSRVTPLVASWAGILGLRPGRISVRDSHRVWASCSRQGNLNFSLRCAGLSEKDLSYLVLHELAHMVHFDHGPGFRRYLSDHMPDWKEREAHLSAVQEECDIFLGL